MDNKNLEKLLLRIDQIQYIKISHIDTSDRMFFERFSPNGVNDESCSLIIKFLNGEKVCTEYMSKENAQRIYDKIAESLSSYNIPICDIDAEDGSEPQL